MGNLTGFKSNIVLVLGLAEEYDAAQERGEVAGHGGNHGNQFANVDRPNVATAADLGLRRDEIHEARKLRAAEAAEPGIVERTIDGLAEAEPPSRGLPCPCGLGIVSVGLRTRTVIAATPDQGFIRWRGWQRMGERLAASHMPTGYVGVVAPYKTACGKTLRLSHGRFLTPRRQSVAGRALRSQTVRIDMTNTNTTQAPRPVQDWENEDVQREALAGKRVYDAHLAEVTKLRQRQEAYEASLPKDAVEAMDDIRESLKDLRDIDTPQYAPRAALTIVQELVLNGDLDGRGDIRNAVYWLSARGLDGLDLIESGSRRALDIASQFHPAHRAYEA